MPDDDNNHSVDEIDERLRSSIEAPKCHKCGCFQGTVDSLEETELAGELAETLAASEETFEDQRYDCLGCDTCWPSEALRIADELVELPTGAGCPTEPPDRRDGWPPYPGDYRVLGYTRPVAVCTLHSDDLVAPLADARPDGVSVVGALQTENLGIERIVENVVANPHIRRLVLCGEDTEGRIGHFPGQSLKALVEHGTDEEGRIVEAEGRRPALENITDAMVARFREQVEIVDRIGEGAVETLVDEIEAVADQAPEPMDRAWESSRDTVRTIPAREPERLRLDRAGYVVITPDRNRGRLVAEHYTNDGVLDAVVAGESARAVMHALLDEDLVGRMDHAAYLGRELALAELALTEGRTYVQDRAPGEIDETSGASDDSGTCGCAEGGCR